MDKESKKIKRLGTLREVCLANPDASSHCFFIKGTPDMYIKLKDPEEIKGPSVIRFKVVCLKVIKATGDLVKTTLFVMKDQEPIEVKFKEALPILDEGFEKAKINYPKDSLAITQYKELGFK